METSDQIEPEPDHTGRSRFWKWLIGFYCALALVGVVAMVRGCAFFA